LFALDRAAQVGSEGKAFEGRGMQARLEVLGATATGALGVIHGSVCIAQQVFGRRRLGVRRGDADAGGHEHISVLDLEWCAQSLDNAVREITLVPLVASLLDQDGELIAT